MDYIYGQRVYFYFYLFPLCAVFHFFSLGVCVFVYLFRNFVCRLVLLTFCFFCTFFYVPGYYSSTRGTSYLCILVRCNASFSCPFAVVVGGGVGGGGMHSCLSFMCHFAYQVFTWYGSVQCFQPLVFGFADVLLFRADGKTEQLSKLSEIKRGGRPVFSYP